MVLLRWHEVPDQRLAAPQALVAPTFDRMLSWTCVRLPITCDSRETSRDVPTMCVLSHAHEPAVVRCTVSRVCLSSDDATRLVSSACRTLMRVINPRVRPIIYGSANSACLVEGMQELPHRGVVRLHTDGDVAWIHHAVTNEKSALPGKHEWRLLFTDDGQYGWCASEGVGSSIVNELIEGVVCVDAHGNQTVQFDKPVRGLTTWPLLSYQNISQSHFPSWSSSVDPSAKFITRVENT